MTNIVEPLWRRGNNEPRRIALRGSGKEWTYGTLRDRIATVAGAVRERGLEPGDRALLVGSSVPEFAAAYYGLHAAGVTVVAMNPMATAFELDYVLRDAQCRLAIAWHESSSATRQAAGALGIEVLSLGPEAGGDLGGSAIEAPHDSDDDATAVILYTSGTTGQPKGAELTHANLLASAEITGELVEATSDDVFATALPLFHVFGGSIVMGTALVHGAALSLLASFDVTALQRMIARDRVTVFAGVPTMYNAMLYETSVEADLSCLRRCLSGGASLPEEVLYEFDRRFGAGILEGYGLTETTGVGTFNGFRRAAKPGFVGPASPRMEVLIVDENGQERGPEEVGELIVRGPTLMKGYFGRPEATAEAIRDGWLFTGDLGVKDADGDIRIVDRKKDLILHGGYNVYPREVEEILYQHPDIVEVAVIGIDDSHYGEQVAAIVVPQPGADLDADGLRAWTKLRLSAYKAPRLYRFVDALPKSATGKILKRSIADEGFVRAAATRATSGS